jgi:pyruvate,water dikinase
MTNSKYCVWFRDVGKEDGGLVGGKGANLGEMTGAGIPVPPGFIVTAQAYFKFIKKAGLKPKIEDKLKNLNYNNSKELQSKAKEIRTLIKKSEIPKSIARQIFSHYHLLSKQQNAKRSIIKRLKNIIREPLVAVRSSATAEDLPEASFAGQQETYLNVRGDANVIETVRKAWASLFTARAVFYRAEKGFDHLKVGIALPIQIMIESEASGVMFTIDPVTNNKSNIVVEAIYGLGELIVQGAVTPDHYVVDKKKMVILKKHISRQEMVMKLKGGKNQELKIKSKDAKKQKISDKQIISLAKYGKKLEKHYFFPQDIEWAIEDNNIFIVQTRPITTISKNEESFPGAQGKSSILEKELKLILSGSPASPGIASGRVVKIYKASEINKVRGGDILVAPMTNPDFVPAMRRAVAIVTEKGGRTSHAAIVSRELGIPAIVGVKNALDELALNQLITVDGAAGKIYKGGLVRSAKKLKDTQDTSPITHYTSQLKTATRVYCNLATIHRAKEVAELNVDGVGLLRAEFMIADIGYHPRFLILKKKQKLFIDTLTKNIAKFCKYFGSDRPIIYRATDFKSNEYKSLKGGKAFEQDEENPMLGFRGAYRYISNPDVFKMELAAIKNVRNKLRFRNLWLMIPFVRTIEELRQVKRLVQEAGLHRSGSFKLWMMVEIPSNVILIDDFIKAGIDGISIGSNDLTQLTLGVDRDSQQVAKEFNEFDPAVLWSIERVIKAAGKHNITSSICGQAPSDYPDLVEKLVKWGITSVSVNPDAIERTREFIYRIEKRVVKKR